MIPRILASKDLVASLFAAGTGMTLCFQPFPEGNVFLQVIALRSPSAFGFLKYSYDFFLFSTPCIGCSVLLSGLYVFALKAKQRIRAGRLPLYAAPQQREQFFVLVLNGQFRETTQRITTAEKAASPEFQAWLRYKNARADICIGMHALKRHASTRMKDDIESISKVYLDPDYGGTPGLDSVQNSDLVPRPNYVLNNSPEQFQIVWKVAGMTIDEVEALNQALVREFDGDPAASDATRVLRLPGFANKKHQTDFYVQARAESAQTYHLRDFKLEIISRELS